MNPTTEQCEILAEYQDGGHLMVSALAGTGKSATIRLLDQHTADPALYLVFNRLNADEALGAFRPLTTVKTFNGLGHQIWGKSCARRISIDPGKMRSLWRNLLAGATRKDQPDLWDAYPVVMDGVEMAKALGFVPPDGQGKSLATWEQVVAVMDTPPGPLAEGLIHHLLRESIATAYQGTLDFNDQVYMPAVFPALYPSYPIVFVDEYQDLNPCNHEMIRRLVAKGARLVGVGDPWQAIYAWRGADPKGMAKAVSAYSMPVLPLTISFRCPSAIVKNVHWRVPTFRWWKEGGAVTTATGFTISGFPESATIICRNNAPLLSLAFQLISAGRAVTVAGHDIGPRLVRILKGLSRENVNRSTLLRLIEDWRAARLTSRSAGDIADCLKVFAEHGDTLSQAVGYANHIFTSTGPLLLYTGHRSKGLEWPTVYFLDPGLIGKEEQELNLRYVISTRSSDTLTHIKSSELRA